MSWFDTSGFASLAKTALKEAQKTIDKALDIKDDDITASTGQETNTPVDSNSEDFFSSWGINHSGTVKSLSTNNSVESETSSPVITKSPTKTSTKINNMTTSLWGSFTGSFFESPKGEHPPFDKTVQHTVSVESLADDSSDIGAIDEKFSKSKLVVREISEDGECSIRSRLSSVDIETEEDKEIILKSPMSSINEIIQTLANAELLGDNKLPSAPVVKRRERPNSFHANRLSVISSESGRNSSESVEVLTGCTTTPDSEVTSAAHSVSTSSSIQGARPPSDSVEVLPDSLTSPSSVEILGSEATNSHRLSQITDEEFVSPFQSPVDHGTFKEDDFKASPDSVEIIPEALEEEEQSVADDSISYMSISESTDATVLEPHAFKQECKFDLNRTQKLSKEMAESITSELSMSPDRTYNIGEPILAITQAPSRSVMHLPLNHTTMSSSQPTLPGLSGAGVKELSRSTQSLINTQPQPSGAAQMLPILLDSVKIIDIPSLDSSSQSSQFEMQNESNDEGSQSDRTLIAEGESGGVESSSDEMPAESTTTSSYLKNMIADAMIEKSPENSVKSSHFLDLTQNMMVSCQSDGTESISISQLDMPPRDQSPISSESRSDLVKIGSEQTSGHTSGDELETTTSSDIEIISSPNGDSSSVQSGSRQSPAKMQKFRCSNDQTSAIEMLFGKSGKCKAKGHNRELSETSSHSDDSHSEIDRLLKRVSEMTEILEAREAKLIDTTRINAELQELNMDLKHQLETILSKQDNAVDLNLVTEEYTQRLSALERKFQQAIREKDILRKQLDQAKQDAATRMSKGELESVVGEKDETIKELRQEGEKLSKQQLQHSNIIKKLRAKEKENESTIKHLKERVEELTSETDRLKRSLTAKEEVERSQIDAVHQLTAKNKKLENETCHLKSQLDDINHKMDTMRKSLEAAKRELTENNRASSELQVRQLALESLENEKRITQMQNEEIMSQLDDLRQKLRNAEQEHLKKEQALRKENVNLMRRVEDAEARNEELAQSVSQATRPLIRQLETLQATHSMKLSAWENQEQILVEKLKTLQEKLSSLTERERTSREECLTLRSSVSSMETKISNTAHQLELLTTQLEQQKAENLLLQQEYTREKNSYLEQIKIKENELSDLNNEITMLKEQLSIEKSFFKAEELKTSQIPEHDQGDAPSIFRHDSSPETRTTSPTLSLRRLSFSESLSSSAWHPDDHLETSSVSRYTNVFEMEGLQSALKQKDGEVQQLQWELSRRENERTYLTTEISNLMVKMEGLEQKVQEHETMKEQFLDLQQQYDALCQMYGEKVEETQELRLDLEDVKEMYKTQIDELLKQNKSAK